MKKWSGSEHGVSLYDLKMFLKSTDVVLKANTAGYLTHLAYNDDEAKRGIR